MYKFTIVNIQEVHQNLEEEKNAQQFFELKDNNAMVAEWLRG